MFHIKAAIKMLLQNPHSLKSLQAMRMFQYTGARNIRSNPRMINQCIRSFTSDTLPEPPLVLRMRSDMKDAMREKDKNRLALRTKLAFFWCQFWHVADQIAANRLNVLRGLLADIINSSKINRAITHDHQVVALLKSRIKLSENAAAEFAAAERGDLKANEEAQVSILRRYLDRLEKVSDEDIKNAALEALDILRTEGKKIHMGAIIKLLIGSGGRFYGQYLDMPSVTRIVREVVFTGRTEIP